MVRGCASSAIEGNVACGRSARDARERERERERERFLLTGSKTIHHPSRRTSHGDGKITSRDRSRPGHERAAFRASRASRRRQRTLVSRQRAFSRETAGTREARTVWVRAVRRGRGRDRSVGKAERAQDERQRERLGGHAARASERATGAPENHRPARRGSGGSVLRATRDSGKATLRSIAGVMQRHLMSGSCEK